MAEYCYYHKSHLHKEVRLDMSTLLQQKSITLKYQKKEGIITVMRKPTETFFPPLLLVEARLVSGMKAEA